ncbi:lytic transglycosylase domain-containing protein [Viridibacillus sp. YIM B01967]|uniref:Lytic transglycosylase domain-containing protein n=1 Tax=Viridibacillus soli TaxID=2798301 RepID=A0ABS1H657_9BACL|nr:lytic transglycosylase domain-containing protein [Viridibacillus soli]MBK3494904.1 lytic transglycosylase domain-containing protein [Viridibacillus soli]
MDISALKTLLEIQGLQSMGSTSLTATDSSSSSSSMFTQLMNEMMTSSTSTSQTDTSQLLGLTSSLSSSGTDYSKLSQLLNDSNNSDSTDYASLLGSGSMNSSTTGSGNAPSSLYYSGTSPVYRPSSMSNNTYNPSPLTQELTGFNAIPGPTSVTSNKQYDAIIKKASETYGIPEKLIKSVIKQESNFNNSVVSHAGAAGLMQLMPGTAKFLGVSNVHDPEQNIMGGTKYLKQMLDKFGGNTRLMLAAYNAGPGNVSKYGGIPPFKETTNYVTKIMNTYQA